MSPRYTEALSEVDYIINNLENEEIEKIPSKLRMFIANNKSRTYKIVGVENLKEETFAILDFIYRKYLAPIEERERLEQEFLGKLKQEKELRKYNNINSQFDYRSKVIVNNEKNVKVNECKDIAEYVKDKWYKKLFYKIKCLFSRNAHR